MQNYLIRQETPIKNNEPTIDPNLESATLDVALDTTLQTNNDHLPSEDLLDLDAVRVRLADQMSSYLSAPRAPVAKNRSEKARALWEDLNTAITSVTAILKEKAKKDKSLRFPQSIIDNLKEFNILRFKFMLDGTKLPTEAASLATAQSSIRQNSSKDEPQHNRSGIYLARNIAKQARHIVRYRELAVIKHGNRTNHKSLLNNNELRASLFKWAASQVPGAVTPITFQSFVINDLLPSFGIDRSISRECATRWMVKLGFRSQVHKKCLYFDGHKRPDVVKSRIEYLETYTMYRKRSRMYNTETFQQSSRVDPEVLGSMKETIFVFHDESTIHAKERPKSSWLLPGTTEILLEFSLKFHQIRSKNTGRLIHISDFILETSGRLELSDIEFQSSQHDGGTKPVSADAATVIYPGSNGDPWWDMEQLCEQVSKKAIPIFQHLHPNSQAVFIFDCSSAHGAFSKTALRVQNMNLKPGGKQSHLRDSIIPCDDPCIPLHLRGRPQTFSYDSSHPDPKLAGQAKGIQTILEERGLWQHYSSKAHESNNSSTCCWSKIMSCQSDFVNERPLLQQIIEDSGHVCLFLPKFHCELNPIELFWSYIKDWYRKQSHTTQSFPAAKDLFEKVRKSCPLVTIRKYFCRIDQQISAYQQGYNGPQSQVLMKK
ncbi:uncharacterized protein PGTG_14424 [Puccinia graminis f. sp. tritici CRL 75-36-700-3]|uniref:Tc1-like transposase DDE domain-containing protein n=1 Tax=Puccinia graminis f. sp. tritici (strain CRL 75-36-700-3 / race SCCL) TaxID=418459 RepID=E3KVK0_PUCGT|nr:uncharacterized protein PGTG_14424 [Puccinia graminis f. sp. tritici CRL 75-36-700-3]EFP88340.2 hypothetical protein PGTG_14424 [Puccinia graminis f. sp. tritici CRL 75-36-700-3]